MIVYCYKRGAIMKNSKKDFDKRVIISLLVIIAVVAVISVILSVAKPTGTLYGEALSRMRAPAVQFPAAQQPTQLFEEETIIAAAPKNPPKVVEGPTISGNSCTATGEALLADQASSAPNMKKRQAQQQAQGAAIAACKDYSSCSPEAPVYLPSADINTMTAVRVKVTCSTKLIGAVSPITPETGVVAIQQVTGINCEQIRDTCYSCFGITG